MLPLPHIAPWREKPGGAGSPSNRLAESGAAGSPQCHRRSGDPLLVTSLRKGRIENPGYKKLKAIAKAMGFPLSFGSKKALNSIKRSE
jgi:hypothetical protein